MRTDAKVSVTEDIREWEYGQYEGITSQEIRERRKAQGLDGWDIWRDGCPGGEYVITCIFSLVVVICLFADGGNSSVGPQIK